MAVDDSFTKLLLHMDGENNGVTFADENGKTVTPYGNAKTISSLGVNCALSKTYYDGGHYSSTSTGAKAFDGVTNTAFEGDGAPDWDAVDLGSGVSKKITKLRILSRNSGGYMLKNFNLQGSNDSTNGLDGTWSTVASLLQADNANWQEHSFSNSVAYRWYRIYAYDSYRTDWTAASFYECEMYDSADNVLAKFGNAVCRLDGDGDYLSVPIDTDLQLDIGDFTIDYWIYPISRIKNYPIIFSNTNSNWSTGALAVWAGRGNDTFYMALNTNEAAINAGAIVYGAWEHHAIVRKDGVIKFYRNGVSKGSVSSSAAINGLGGYFQIGKCGSDANTYLNALVDEFRVSKGIARWSADFTPPTAAYGPAAPTGSKRRFAQII